MKLKQLVEQANETEYALIVLSMWDMQELQNQLLTSGASAEHLRIGRTPVVAADVRESFGVKGYPETTIHLLLS